MIFLNPLPSPLLKGTLFSKMGKLFLLCFMLSACHSIAYSQVSLEGSWGVTFPVFGGERLDDEVDSGNYNYLSGAQEVVDELPAVGHIITNLSYFAHSHYFPFSANTNVNVASKIHPSMVPSAKNDEIIFDVYDIFKKADKRIILYISTNYLDRASDEVQAAWKLYYKREFGGDEYLAYKHLIKGFVETVKDYADGYWFDTAGKLKDEGNFDDFVAMFKEVDPTAVMGSYGGEYLSVNEKLIYVDSDGTGDEDSTNYSIVIHEPQGYEDFTKGHITPLGQGAPPNSWAYEEFTVPNMMAYPVVQHNGKSVVKHAWFPIRNKWHSPRADIMFDTEEAYRFVRRITDAGAAITFATTIQETEPSPGHMMADEMAIMKEINRRLLLNPLPDYVPYTRPDNASLVGETQYIDFPDIPVKNVGDADFSPATASSGLAVALSSSATNVATIVNDKVHIVGGGRTVITAMQAGNASHAPAINAIRPLVVASDPKLDQTITFNELLERVIGDVPFSPGAIASSGSLVSYTSSNPSVAVIVGRNIHIMGAGSAEITASQAGDLAYKAAPNKTRTLTVLPLHVTAISTNASENKIKIYPNPVNDQLFIALSNAQQLSYSISTLTGKLILSGDIKEGITFVDVDRLIAGLYVICVFDEQVFYTRKIIKK